MNIFLQGFIAIAFAYLLGSIPFGLIVAKIWANIDIREHGSGNIGVSNVLRTAGVVPATIVFILDAGKGLVPVLLAKQIFANETIWLLVGLCAIIGHTWPIFLNFKGGRGVATTCGMLIGLSLKVILVLIAIWIITLVISRYISLASIFAAVALPICLVIFKFPISYFVLSLFLSSLVIYRHRPNIQRLLAGTEYRIGEKAR